LRLQRCAPQNLEIKINNIIMKRTLVTPNFYNYCIALQDKTTSNITKNYMLSTIFGSNDIRLTCFKNVISYKYINHKPELDVNTAEDDGIITKNEDESTVSKFCGVEDVAKSKFCGVEDVAKCGGDGHKEIYYILDCNGLDAFAHWVFECFISYKNIIELNKIYPQIKIITNNRKKYVKTFLHFFNINNEIIYHDTDYVNYKNIPNPNNICFFPRVISLNDNNTDVNYLSMLINDFSIEIYNKLPLLEHQNKILLLPRNKVDNFGSNDRILYGIEDIEKNVIEMGGVVLDTYNLNNMFFQFTMIKNSETIILDYGSSYLVNSIFLKNKKIIVLNNVGWFNSQTNNFITCKTISDFIIKNNNVIIVNNTSNRRDYIDFSNIKDFL